MPDRRPSAPDPRPSDRTAGGLLGAGGMQHRAHETALLPGLGAPRVLVYMDGVDCPACAWAMPARASNTPSSRRVPATVADAALSLAGD